MAGKRKISKIGWVSKGFRMDWWGDDDLRLWKIYKYKKSYPDCLKKIIEPVKVRITVERI